MLRKTIAKLTAGALAWSLTCTGLAAAVGAVEDIAAAEQANNATFTIEAPEHIAAGEELTVPILVSGDTGLNRISLELLYSKNLTFEGMSFPAETNYQYSPAFPDALLDEGNVQGQYALYNKDKSLNLLPAEDGAVVVNAYFTVSENFVDGDTAAINFGPTCQTATIVDGEQVVSSYFDDRTRFVDSGIMTTENFHLVTVAGSTEPVDETPMLSYGSGNPCAMFFAKNQQLDLSWNANINSNIRDGEWICSDSTIAEVDQNGRLTALGGGATTVIYGDPETGEFIEYDVLCEFDAPAVTGHDILYPSAGISLCGTKDSVQLSAYPYTGFKNDETAEITWESSNEDVVTVTPQGLVEIADGAISGFARISLTVRWAEKNHEISTAFYVHVFEESHFDDNPLLTTTTTAVDGTTTITTTVTEPEALFESQYDEKGKVLWLNKPDATYRLNNAAIGKTLWYSSDQNVATVDDAGLVTAVGSGKCTLVYGNAETGKTEVYQVICNFFSEKIVTGKPMTDLYTVLSYPNCMDARLYTEDYVDKADIQSTTWSSSAPDMVSVTSYGGIELVAPEQTIANVVIYEHITRNDGSDVVIPHFVYACTYPVTGVELLETCYTMVVGEEMPAVVPFDMTILNISSDCVKVVDGSLVATGVGCAEVVVHAPDYSHYARFYVSVFPWGGAVESAETTPTFDASNLIGDVSGDKVTSIADVVMLARFVSQDDTAPKLSSNARRLADVNGDGETNAEDISALSRQLAGLE